MLVPHTRLDHPVELHDLRIAVVHAINGGKAEGQRKLIAEGRNHASTGAGDVQTHETDEQTASTTGEEITQGARMLRGFHASTAGEEDHRKSA
jgi:hypothetical protein